MSKTKKPVGVEEETINRDNDLISALFKITEAVTKRRDFYRKLCLTNRGHGEPLLVSTVDSDTVLLIGELACSGLQEVLNYDLSEHQFQVGRILLEDAVVNAFSGSGYGKVTNKNEDSFYRVSTQMGLGSSLLYLLSEFPDSAHVLIPFLRGSRKKTGELLVTIENIGNETLSSADKLVSVICEKVFYRESHLLTVMLENAVIEVKEVPGCIALVSHGDWKSCILNELINATDITDNLGIDNDSKNLSFSDRLKDVADTFTLPLLKQVLATK